MQLRLPSGIRDVIQIGVVVGLIPVICAPFVIGGAEWISWLRFGYWPNWSPLALGWWNHAEHATGWAEVDRVLDAIAGSNVLMLIFLALMAVDAFGRIEDWRERRAFEKWYHRRASTPHI